MVRFETSGIVSIAVIKKIFFKLQQKWNKLKFENRVKMDLNAVSVKHKGKKLKLKEKDIES